MKKSRDRITFEGDSDSEALALAMMGQSDRAIIRQTGLTPNQINYRLAKAKRIERNKHGYRVAWRNGESAMVKQVKADLLAITKREIQRTLPQQIAKPTPKTIRR